MLSLVMHTLQRNLRRWEADGSAAKARKHARTQQDIAAKRCSLANPREQRAASQPEPSTDLTSDLSSATDDGTLSMEAVVALSAALDEQERVLNDAATVIQSGVRFFLARLRAARRGYGAVDAVVRTARKIRIEQLDRDHALGRASTPALSWQKSWRVKAAAEAFVDAGQSRLKFMRAAVAGAQR